MSDPSSTVILQGCLDRLQAGEAAARDELIKTAFGRLMRLARKMLRGDGRLPDVVQTDDVFSGSALRLWQELGRYTPRSLREFLGVAARAIRQELIDLARHYYGPRRQADKLRPLALPGHSSGPSPHDPADTDSVDPGRLAEWTEFHERIAALPDEEREVFDLVYYQGLTHAEAAAVLGVSTKWIQRRWHAGCLRLMDAMQGDLPEL